MIETSKEIDLKAVPCPLNVVKCKLALEKLSPNQVLIVYLDKGEPEEMIKNVLKKMRYSFKKIEDNEKTLKLRIVHEDK